MKFFMLAKNFGLGFAIKYSWLTLLYKITKNKKHVQKKHNLINNYLTKRYLNILTPGGDITPLDKDYKVWVFWYQGQAQMPQVVKVCYANIKKYFGDKVVLITKDNFAEYVDIPDYILQKVDKKLISITFFSDILRASLLSKYGGLWIDSTIYLAGDIKEDIEGKPFFTNKLKKIDGDSNISGARWSGFFMAGNKDNPLFVNMRRVFLEYLKTHNCLISYFLIDYTINFIYNNNPKVKQMMDDVPPNNPNIHFFAKNLFKPYNKTKYEELLKDTKVFKLTYRFNEKKTQIPDTYYANIIGKV